ncbi:uncharacterized protein LOC108740774 [Agrilus planipennis]|uniref:Uncharacterized protein LOC108740774 n=1 Tax=Agrilus planipennis TaxID=224129 RepID=A0A1W4X3T3_AGRPL|nr:uncharacterized protein LOC108740774 [Agrilus planipennis]
MIRNILICLLFTLVASKPQNNLDPLQFERELEQNRNARYQFNNDVDDQIQDLTQSRQETREGLKVTGKYSYSDGFVKRTVFYEADDKGYRVTATESVPLGNGPQFNPSGTASVSMAQHGKSLSYRVVGVPHEGPVVKHVDSEKVHRNN